jgi:hypothetical protein
MAVQGWRGFFGNDEGAFNDWYVTLKKRVIYQISVSFKVRPETAEDFVSEAFKICLNRPQPKNRNHLEGALVLTAKNIARNATRWVQRRNSPAGEPTKITARPTTGRTVGPEELSGNGPVLDDIAAGLADRAFLLAELTALKEFLRRKGFNDALAIITVIERAGQDLKRAEMVQETGLNGPKYDAARKKLTRAAASKEVQQRARELWVDNILNQRHDATPRQASGDGAPSDRSLTELEYNNVSERIQFALKGFDREFASRKRNE